MKLLNRIIGKLFPPKPISIEDYSNSITWIRSVVSSDIFCKNVDDAGYSYIGNTDKNGVGLSDASFKKFLDDSFYESWRMSDEELIKRYNNRYRRQFNKHENADVNA
jgi:hypothetical protein